MFKDASHPILVNKGYRNLQRRINKNVFKKGVTTFNLEPGCFEWLLSLNNGIISEVLPLSNFRISLILIMQLKNFLGIF